MPAILDVAIGTLFVFLLFSLIVSALNEYILSLTDQRAKFLRLGLAELFGQRIVSTPGFSAWLKRSFTSLGGLLSHAHKTNVGPDGEKLLGHGLINAFSRSDNGGTSPSYIPAGAFVTALLDNVVTKPASSWTPADAAPLTSLIGAIRAAKAAAIPPAPPIDQASYTTALTAFTNAYQPPAMLPVADTFLGRFHYRVAEALANPQTSITKAAAQTALSVAPDFKAAVALIPNQPAELQPLLYAFANVAGGDLPVFKQLLGKLVAPVTPVKFDTELAVLEGTAAAGIAMMVRPALEHSAEAIEASLNALPPSKLKESLLSLYRTTEGDVQKFKLAVEGWFNGVMDRVSGWYKRFAQKWMIVLGFLLAAILNVDTIEIVRVLSNNPNLAAAVATQAETYVTTNRRPLSAEERDKLRLEKLKKVAEAEAELAALQAPPETRVADPTTPVTTPDPTQPNATPDSPKDVDAAKKERKAKIQSAEKKLAHAQADADTLKDYQKAVARLSGAGLPVGWSEDRFKAAGGWKPAFDKGAWENFKEGFAWFLCTLWVLLTLVPGWFITAIAGSLGAPFWFDLLGRFVNIRAAGRAPGEKEPSSTPTRPPPASLDTTLGTARPAQ